MNTSTRRVIFLDFDGVLHRGDVYRTPNGIVPLRPSVDLFEFAHLLAESIEPYPRVRLVLSTSWVSAIGFKRTREFLPLPELRSRVTGATFYSKFRDRRAWNEIPRGEQIKRYVARHNLATWLAIDDRDDGFEDVQTHLVHCDKHLGLGSVDAQLALQQALREKFGIGEGA
jgi:hypothetical protein